MDSGVVRADSARLEAAKKPHKWAVFAVVAIGVLMATLDSSIVNISLPSIALSFGRPLDGQLQWVVIAYLIVIVALLLTAGRLGDMFGRRLVWQLGLVLFILGSAACGLAPRTGVLVACRALQGVGAAALMAQSPALLTSAFPPSERGRALGLNALVVAVGVSTGPPLGGFITEHLSWRWIFFINVPLGVLGVSLAAWLLSRPPARARAQFDLGGAVLLGLGLASFTAALTFGHDLGWSSPLILGGFGASAVALPWLVRHEARHPAPVIELSLFRSRVFVSAFGSLILSFLALFAVAFLTPFYLEQVRGLSAAQSGARMLAYPLAIAMFAPLAGALSDKIGSRVLAPIGMLVAACALMLLGNVSATTPLLRVQAILALGGLGQALFQPANNSALLGAAPPDRQGLAGGLLATGRVLGQSLSVAVAGAIFAGLGGAEAGRLLAAHPAARDPSWIETFMESYRGALHACAAFALCGALIALARRAAK
jgi:EmrB/QacA subfamily drug resistance transporter